MVGRLILVALLGALFAALACMKGCLPCPGGTADFDADLVIQHEDLMAFTQLNNSFSSTIMGDGSDAPCSDELENFWSGLLMHMGDYEDECFEYQGVRITLTDGTVHELAPPDFQWINIVSEYSRNRRNGCDGSYADCYQPMLPEDVFKIMPTTEHSDDGSSCWSLTECKRAAPLHARMRSIPNILTYWQGDNGYTMQSDYKGFPDETHNSYELDFGDDYEVWVYEVASADGESCTVTEKHYFAEVERIEVVGGIGGSGSGVRMDPPVP